MVHKTHLGRGIKAHFFERAHNYDDKAVSNTPGRTLHANTLRQGTRESTSSRGTPVCRHGSRYQGAFLSQTRRSVAEDSWPPYRARFTPPPHGINNASSHGAKNNCGRAASGSAYFTTATVAKHAGKPLTRHAVISSDALAAFLKVSGQWPL